jgi:hypothetical protein
MPATYKKAPRRLMVAPVSDGRRSQPSDNDFTVLLSRDSRFAVMPPPPRVAVAPVARIAPAAPIARTAPVAPVARIAPVARVAPPVERRAPEPPAPLPIESESVAPPPIAISLAPAPRTHLLRSQPPTRAGLAVASVLLAAGCMFGMGLELVHNGRAQAASSSAEPTSPAVPRGVAGAPKSVAAQEPTVASPALVPGVAAGPPSTLASTDARPESLSSPLPPVLLTHAEPTPAAARHHHRHQVHTPALAHAAPPPAPAPPASSPPVVAELPLPESDPSDPPVAGTPAAAGSALPDDIAAAIQTLTQAKAELAL